MHQLVLPRLLRAFGRTAAAAAIERTSASDDRALEHQQMRAVLEHMTEAAILLDRHGRVSYATPSAPRLFRCAADALVGQPLTAVGHPDDRDELTTQLGRATTTENGFAALIFRTTAADEGCTWIEARFRPHSSGLGIVATCLDVTSIRRRADGAASGPRSDDAHPVRAALDKLQLAIEQTADSVLITDRNGVIEYVNPAFEAMSGYTRDETIGRRPSILRSGAQNQRFYESLWSTILSGRSFRSTMQNRRRDGTVYDEDQMITPIRDASGTITHFVSTGRDVTHRNRTQEALRRLNQQLESQAARIAASLHDEAGQFLAAAHIALADLAHDVEPTLCERLARIRRHLDQVEERLRHIAHDMHPRVVEDLGLADAVAFLAGTFMQRTGLVVDVETSISTRHPVAVETLLYRVVQEALNNVVRHANAAKAVVTLKEEHETICCSIRDDGAGFDPAAQAMSEGSLGLRVMEDRLAAVGGTLTIVSAPGQGTELRASVPVKV